MRGNTGSAPIKVIDEKGLSSGGQRWRFLSLRDRLDSTSARPSALPSIDFSQNLQGISPDDVTFSHFATTLTTNSDDNITAAFTNYVYTVRPLSLSLPLIFRNRKRILDITLTALQDSARSTHATTSLATCLAAFGKDLGSDHLHPLFEQITTSFATILSLACAPIVKEKENIPQDDKKLKKNTKKRSKKSKVDTDPHAAIWDPQASLVPLFSALAEITRILLPTLATNPSQTVISLRPLLSHANYRVREMTAEACLGYVVRKTRDENVRMQLICAIVHASSQNEKYDTAHACDGFGVALFEAVRLPSGHVHKSTPKVVSAVVQSLLQRRESDNKKDEITDYLIDSRLSIASRYFANLIRHTQIQEDVQNIIAQLVMEGNTASDDEDVHLLGDILFLLRRSIVQGGKRVCNHLGTVYIHRLITFLTTVIEKFGSHPRIVYETVDLLITFTTDGPENLSNKLYHTTLPRCIKSIANCDQTESMNVVISLIVQRNVISQTEQHHVGLIQAMAEICEKLATLSVTEIFIEELSQTIRISLHSLSLCLNIFHLLHCESNRQTLSQEDFCVPTLNSQVCTFLTCISKLEITSKVFVDEKVRSTLSSVLDYLGSVQVADVKDPLSKLAEIDGLPIQDVANVLIALYPYCRKEQQPSAEILSRTEQLIDLLVQYTEKSSPSPIILTALCTGAQRELEQASTILKSFSKGSKTALTRLTQNLSSDNISIRILSANLLSSLFEPQTLATANQKEVFFFDDKELKHIVENEDDNRLGMKEQQASTRNESIFYNFFRTFRQVLGVSRSLMDIDRCAHLIQGLCRSVQTARNLPRFLVTAILHFFGGVLRTPVQTLWKSAGDLWCLTAKHDNSAAMSVIMSLLTECESRILSQAEVQRAVDEEEHVMKINENNLDHESEQEEDFGSGKGTRKRRRSGRKQDIPVLNSKRQKRETTDAFLMKWNPSTWEEFIVCRTTNNSLNRLSSSTQIQDDVSISTDDSTVLIELLKVLTLEPKNTLKNRLQLIQLYLRLDLPKFSRKSGIAFGIAFTSLLEKMGGLKCSGNDTKIECALRSRLLFNVTYPDPSLQVSSLRCLCVSRSQFLKPHRDSFIRLIEDATFREELALITESFLSQFESSNDNTRKQEQNAIADVLVRICFSKMRMKKAKANGNKSAVLSFLASKLPADMALPRLCSLALEPLECLINPDEDMKAEDTYSNTPSIELQRGVLDSLEAIINTCRQLLPKESWEKIASANVALLHNSGKGSDAQAIRSRTLRLLASMQQFRPDQSNVVMNSVLTAMQNAGLENMDVLQLSSAPAFLKYAAALFSDTECPNYSTLFTKYVWATKFCLGILRSEKADVQSVNLSLQVAKGIMQYYLEAGNSVDAMSTSLHDSHQEVDVSLYMVQSLEFLLNRLVTVTQTDKSLEKLWSPSLNQALEVIISLSKSEMFSANVLISLADSLIIYLESPRTTSTLQVAMKTLHSLALQICSSETKGTQRTLVESFRSSILRLIPLFANRFVLEDRLAYAALCQVIRSIGLVDLQGISTTLNDLNCSKEQKLESQDLDKAIEALNKIISALKSVTSEGQKSEDKDLLEMRYTSPEENQERTIKIACNSVASSSLMYACIAAVRHEDTAIRGTAGYALKLMAKWSSLCKSTGSNKFRESLFDQLVTALVSSKNLTERREYGQAVGEFVRCCDVIENSGESRFSVVFPAFKNLSCAKNLESDFFENLVHLQAHRRSRALRQLEGYLLKHRDDNNCGAEGEIVMLASLFSLPLGMRLAVESVSSSKTNKASKWSKHAESQESSIKDVSTWAIQLVGAASKLLPWRDYKSCLLNVLRRLKNEDDDVTKQVLYKLLVHMSDAFPEATKISLEANDSVIGVLETHIIPEMLKHISGGAVEGFIVGRNTTNKGSSGSKHQRGGHAIDSFQAPIAISIGRLMIRLPEENRDHLIPLLITPLSTALRSPLTAPREAAKKALVQVVITLGQKYFKYITSQVLGALKEGFRKDACIYVVHALVEGVRTRINSPSNQRSEGNFSIDGAVPILMKHIQETLLEGRNESSKEFEDPNVSSTRQKHVAARALKASECAEVIAEIIDFDKSISSVCEPIFVILEKSPSSKIRNRTYELLRRLVLGLSRSYSMSIKSVLKFCFSLVSPRTSVTGSEECNMKLGTSEFLHNIEEKPDRVLFALKLLYSTLNKNWASLNTNDNESRELQAMIDPFVPVVTAAFQVGDDELSLAALLASQKLLRLPINGKSDIANSLTSTVIEVLSQSGTTGTQSITTGSDHLFNTCLKSAAILFREVGSKGCDNVTNEKIDTLVKIACNNVERGHTDTRNSALALLRGVVGSKIVTPAVYDAMERVNNLAIHSQSSSMRVSCTSLSISFLISFPLGSKRVRQHLEFFVRNLNYPIANGRLAAIEAVQKIITNFPIDMLEKECEHFFVAVAAVLGRDEDAECRSSALKCVQVLFERLSGSHKVGDLLKMISVFLGKHPTSGESSEEAKIRDDVDPAVRRSGASAITAAARSGILNQAQRSGLFKTLVIVLTELSDESWETTYAVLHAIEALIDSQSNSLQEKRLEVQEFAEKLIQRICPLLTYQHQWVRLLSARLLGTHLSGVGGRKATRSEADKRIAFSVWNSDLLIREILRALCLQLEADFLGPDLAQQSLKNLLCMADVIKCNPDYGNIANDDTNLNGQHIDEPANESDAQTHRALKWLLSRVSGIAVRVGDLETQILRRGCALRFLHVTSKWWESSLVSSYKRLYIAPVVKILESESTSNEGRMVTDFMPRNRTRKDKTDSQAEESQDKSEGMNDGLRTLAEGLQETLTSCIGAAEYYKVYHELQKARNAKKEERKQKAALATAIDPERAAKKRRRKAIMKRTKKHKSGYRSRPAVDIDNSSVLQKRRLTEDL